MQLTTPLALSMTQTCIVYYVDRNNNLIDANEHWDEFALANNAPHLARDSVYQRPLFDLMTDPQCNHLYKLLIERTRHIRHPISFEYRCDSPALRRFMHMEMSHQASNDGVCFKSTILRQESRAPIALLDLHSQRSSESLIICSWCKKLKVSENQWVEIEEAITRLGLFNAEYLPQLSHGICPSCNEAIWSKLIK
ncbi:hypothetical protein [Kaarinaea lacus]